MDSSLRLARNVLLLERRGRAEGVLIGMRKNLVFLPVLAAVIQLLQQATAEGGADGTTGGFSILPRTPGAAGLLDPSMGHAAGAGRLQGSAASSAHGTEMTQDARSTPATRRRRACA